MRSPSVADARERLLLAVLVTLARSLDRWVERALSARSVDEVLAD